MTHCELRYAKPPDQIALSGGTVSYRIKPSRKCSNSEVGFKSCSLSYITVPFVRYSYTDVATLDMASLYG